MLEIEYKGGNSVLITTKGKQLLIDPNVEPIGLKATKTADAVFLATEQRFALPGALDSLQLEGPGEYEVGPFAIKGVAAQRHIDTQNEKKLGSIYHIDVGDIRLAVIGNIDAKLSDEQLETIGVVDVLIIPVGGNGYTLDARSAIRIVAQVEPKVVIPVHYADGAITYEVPQDDVDVFTKELGAPIEHEPKLKLKSSSALPATLTTYVLSRS